jgi:hypothetical protein
MATDLIGTPVTTDERALLDVYDRLTALAERRDELAPSVTANVQEALASIAVVVTDLGLRFEHLIDLGC